VQFSHLHPYRILDSSFQEEQHHVRLDHHSLHSGRRQGAVASPLGTIQHLLKRSIPQNVTDTTFARFLDDKVRMYCQLATSTSDTSNLVGFVTYYPHPSIATITEQVYLNDLFVDESVRSKGTGKKLIEVVYEYAKSIEAASVYWHT
jgi:GNAT superfamily N-acetyltransferase